MARKDSHFCWLCSHSEVFAVRMGSFLTSSATPDWPGTVPGPRVGEFTTERKRRWASPRRPRPNGRNARTRHLRRAVASARAPMRAWSPLAWCRTHRPRVRPAQRDRAVLEVSRRRAARPTIGPGPVRANTQVRAARSSIAPAHSPEQQVFDPQEVTQDMRLPNSRTAPPSRADHGLDHTAPAEPRRQRLGAHGHAHGKEW